MPRHPRRAHRATPRRLGGGRRPGGEWRPAACAHQSGQVQLGSDSEEAGRRRLATVAMELRREDLRKGNRPGEYRNRSRRGRGSSLCKELKGASPETMNRGRPAVGKKVAAAAGAAPHRHGGTPRRRRLELLRPAAGVDREEGGAGGDAEPAERVAAAGSWGARRWPAGGAVDCGLISKKFRGLLETISQRRVWTVSCISRKFEDFCAK